MSTILREVELKAAVSAEKPKTIANDFIRRLQIRHFWLYNVIPFVGFVGALVSLRWLPIGAVEVSLLVGMWALSMVGMSLGLHRYFAHHAFETSPRGRGVLAVLGCMAAQGPVVSWVAVHRRHHERSDKPGDPHSPNPALLGGGAFATLRGLWHAHVGWLTNHEYPNPVHYAPELLRDPLVARINRHYLLWVALGLALPAVIGGLLHGTWLGAFQGFLWGGVVRMVVVDNSVLSINSFSHVFGSHDFETDDHSRNNPWVALPTFGESWQNNHHAFASSAAIGLRWWQVDLGYGLIVILEKLGLVWGVRRPTPAMIASKRVTA
jgi:stearoyl-CoA desaturase (delta-9 desaturase)